MKVSEKIVVGLSFLLLTGGLLLAGFQNRELRSEFSVLREELEAVKQGLASLRSETVALDIFMTGGAAEETREQEKAAETPNREHEEARHISEGVWEVKRMECELGESGPPKGCGLLLETESGSGERKYLEFSEDSIAAFVEGDKIKFGLITSISISEDAITDAGVKGPKSIPAREVRCLKYPAYPQLSHCYEVSDYLVPEHPK